MAELLSEGVSPDSCAALPTSGSSGEPLHVYYTAADMRRRWLYFIRIFRAYGLDFVCRMAEVGQYKKSRIRPRSHRWSADQRSFLSVSDLVDTRLDHLVRADPQAIIGYTNDLAEMASRSRVRGLVFPSLSAVIGVGQMMSSDAREAIRRGWNIEPYDAYGAVETGSIAFECPSRCGTYHVQADNLVLEVLRTDASPAAPGEVGQLAVTTLGYQAMPLVRYLLGDLGSAGPPCGCGCGFPTLERLHGRNDDVITLSTGRQLTPHAVMRVFCGGELRRYRLRQRAAGQFTLEVDGEGDAVARAVRDLREILDPDDRLEVVPLAQPVGRSKERTIVVEAS